MRGLPIILGLGLVGYYLYSKGYFSGGTTTGTTGGTSTGGTHPGTTTGGTGTGTTGGGSTNTGQLAQIYSRMLAAPGVTTAVQYTPDGWGFVFNGYNGMGLTAPDPMTLWPSYDRSNPLQLTISQYWQTMAAYLHSAAGGGLSGYQGWAV